STPSILIFGDSTADTGNNNYIPTIFRSNFPPYGLRFLNHTPTGRFSDGRIAADFFAKHLGIKEYVPPYLDPDLTLEELITGVSFAFAGSGYDPLTASISSVISVPEQLNHFRDYKRKLEAKIGTEKTKESIGKALFLVSAGTNDFVLNYFILPIRRQRYSVEAYASFVVNIVGRFVQGLVSEGARRIGVAGLPPMGCLPVVITLFSDDPINKRDCIENFSILSRAYNRMLQTSLNAMNAELRRRHRGSPRVAYLDVYGPLEAIIHNHGHDFEEVNVGCCGTGLVEASILCTPFAPLCSHPAKYVFWDSIHPTETT
ncbi:hypothetical protein M569_15551, partial [Genlisea aurea]